MNTSEYEMCRHVYRVLIVSTQEDMAYVFMRRDPETLWFHKAEVGGLMTGKNQAIRSTDRSQLQPNIQVQPPRREPRPRPPETLQRCRFGPPFS